MVDADAAEHPPEPGAVAVLAPGSTHRQRLAAAVRRPVDFGGEAATGRPGHSTIWPPSPGKRPARPAPDRPGLYRRCPPSIDRCCCWPIFRAPFAGGLRREAGIGPGGSVRRRGGSPRCLSWPNCCGYQPRPTAIRASRGGRTRRHPRRSTPTGRRLTLGSATPAGPLIQELQSQLDALAAHGIGREKIFAEKISTRMKVRPQFEDALALARQIKAHAPHCRVILTVYEMKRLGRDARRAHCAGRAPDPALAGIYDPVSDRRAS
ncbi:recombinase family protein [Nonomuraea sp. NPDC049695]|uniref:recombinase family protein n=1 Tax=Nonomuraea sp. NPDC049695 TaxID=3154734 RepID=UPI00341F4754